MWLKNNFCHTRLCMTWLCPAWLWVSLISALLPASSQLRNRVASSPACTHVLALGTVCLSASLTSPRLLVLEDYSGVPSSFAGRQGWLGRPLCPHRTLILALVLILLRCNLSFYRAACFILDDKSAPVSNSPPHNLQPSLSLSLTSCYLSHCVMNILKGRNLFIFASLTLF